MALDEAKKTDDEYEIEGFKYIVDKEFMKKAAPIKVDFSPYGFKLTSGMDLGAGQEGCSGCGSSAGGCS
ncbi:conserved hypothetical protein [Candidatus Desulfarcum epimagneticum]|uniref:Uncharacterized protein n=1 Tax=uncultured Desulfobacteraceae bacterium TaxID=218296 RepID=A0A484HLQ8_9BACT|nr:conserved hypothetical protein [uncultured Desulfobacteraceae bacterium]